MGRSDGSFWLRELLALVGLIALPLLVYYLWLAVSDPEHSGMLFVPTLADVGRIPWPTWPSVVIFTVWLLLQALLYQVLPGKWVQGVPLADGSRLRYRLNGLFAFVVSLGLAFGLLHGCGFAWIFPGTVLFEQIGPLLTTVNLFAFALSLALYFFGTIEKPGKTTGRFFYDYFMGVDLHPRIGAFDLKFFFESRPGLIGWVVINYALASEQLKEQGTVTTPMVLVCVFQFIYVADYFFHEEAILTTWDIKHEKFGWMLVWGDLVWVPFTYTLQAYYLIRHPHELPVWGTIGLVALNLAGYVIFRGANWQKHRFRKNPEAAVWRRPAEAIRTQQGSLLLTSGWWGLARHINYLGDLMMALAWCLPCGFASPLPYFYFVYFLILLIHRERRDNAACQVKYGADWDAYCRKVPWRIVPYLY
jgi:delta14-sterol reductase/lamin-B receptor